MAETKQDKDTGDHGVREKIDDFEFNRAAIPVVPTAIDATGIERIVGPAIDNWTPAQVEPDPDEVARMEIVNAALAEDRRTRAGLLTDTDRLDDTAKPLVEANKAEHGDGSSHRSSSSRSSANKES